MERLIENLNKIGFDFNENMVEGFECFNTGARLIREFDEYELYKGSKVLRFKEFQFKDGVFECFVSETIVFECLQNELKGILV